MFINCETVICLKNGTYSVIIYILSGIQIQSDRLDVLKLFSLEGKICNLGFDITTCRRTK